MLNCISARTLAFILPAVLVTGCSIIEQPLLPAADYSQANSGHYGAGCGGGSCAPGQSYSVANAAGYHNQSQSHQAHHGAQGGPVHINPTGHGSTGHGAAAYGHQGYGPQGGLPLRAAQHSPGTLYGTIGAVNYDTDADIFGLEGRLGYDSGRILGAELEASVGVINDDFDVPTLPGIETKANFQYNIAAFGVARLPLGDRFSVHARGGYDFRSLKVKLSDDVDSVEGGVDYDGFAYGIGGQYDLTPRSGVRLDWTRYDNDVGALDSVSASYVRKF